MSGPRNCPPALGRHYKALFTLTIAFTATWDASFIGFTHNSFFLSKSKLPFLFLFPFLEVSSKKRKINLIVLILLSKKEAAEHCKEPVPEAEVDNFQGDSKKDHQKEQEGGGETLMMRVLAPPGFWAGGEGRCGTRRNTS